MHKNIKWSLLQLDITDYMQIIFVTKIAHIQLSMSTEQIQRIFQRIGHTAYPTENLDMYTFWNLVFFWINILLLTFEILLYWYYEISIFGKTKLWLLVNLQLNKYVKTMN